MEIDADPELTQVAAEIRALDPDGSRTARVLRQTLDQLYNGVHTGRYRWDQLHKTEKTHCGTLVEINLQREFKFEDGSKLDYCIAGVEVDCKYSQSDGAWMIPPEGRGRICLVLWANDEESKWKMGVVRARPEFLRIKGNRDEKSALNPLGREAISWIFNCGDLAENLLLQIPRTTADEIMSAASGAERVSRLFRHSDVQTRIVRREVVATVAQQVDYMKRVRDNGGARETLRPEGVIILGHQEAHQEIARALGVLVPTLGELVSVRVSPAGRGVASAVRIDGGWWRVAGEDDPVVEAPRLPMR